MLEFRPITPEMLQATDKEKSTLKIRLCDYAPGCMILWGESFNMLGCVKDGTLYCISSKEPDSEPEGFYYTLPIYTDSLDDSLEIIGYDSQQVHRPLKFCCIPEEYIETLTGHFGKPKSIDFDSTWSDYLYPYDNFCYYKGKALHGQRNHVNRFTKDYPDYRFEPMDSSNIHLAREFMINNRVAFDKDDEYAEMELQNLNKFFDAYPILDLSGGLLFADNKLLGYTIGEAIDDTLHIHVEKALAKYTGAYQTLAMCFAKYMKNDKLIYINRQDDAGDEGLRKSKQGYRPCKMLDKYIITF